MSTGTTLIYNGVILRNCETQSFEQSIEYDTSGTDVMFSRFRIRVTSTLVGFVNNFQAEHSIQVGVQDGSVGGSTPQQIRTVHTKLQQSRKPFYFFIDNAPAPIDLVNDLTELSPSFMLVAAGYEHDDDMFQLTPGSTLSISKVPASQVLDCDNGPKPRSVSVESIYGGRTMRVSFDIEVCRRLCEDGEDPIPPHVSAGELIGAGNKIISNRWGISEQRGEDWKLTRTIDGTLRVASKAVLPHLMRYFVVPTLPRRFKRISQSFATDPTDLVLKYSIQDKQADEAPPPPAIKWSGHFAESGTGANAAKQFSELTIRLEGPPHVNRQDLISAAGHVVKSRIKGLEVKPGENSKNRPIILDTSVVEVIGEPIIEMRVRVNSTALETTLAARIKNIGSPLEIDGYHPDVWPVPSAIEPDSLAGLFSCYLQEPCSVWHSVPRPAFNKSDPTLDGEEPPKDDPSDEDGDGAVNGDDTTARTARLAADPEPVYYVSDAPFESDSKSIAASQFTDEPYTYIRINSRYEIDSGRVQLPFAQSQTDQAGDPTCEIVRIHAGLCRRVFTMEATRRDKPPVMPEPLDEVTDPNGIKEYIDSHDHNFFAPEFGADGISRKFRASATYVYLMTRPPTNAEKFRMAISPIDGTTSELRYRPGSDLYSDSLIEYRPAESPGG